MTLNSDLIHAVIKGNVVGVKKTLEAGADPNSQYCERIYEPFSGSDDYYYNVLSIAIKSNDITIVKILLKYGANPLKTDEYGTSLECAVMYNRKQILLILLKREKKPDHTYLNKLIQDAKFELGLMEKHHSDRKKDILDLRQIIKILENF